MVSGHFVTPLEQIEQVWHLHLIYTRSYWDDSCGEVLGQPLHHGPTKGGQQETAKYRDCYAETLASYERIFGYPAPPDIWPFADHRFGIDTQVQRINVQQNWVVAKPDLSWLSFDLPNWNPGIVLPNPRRLKSWMWSGMAIDARTSSGLFICDDIYLLASQHGTVANT